MYEQLSWSVLRQGIINPVFAKCRPKMEHKQAL